MCTVLETDARGLFFHNYALRHSHTTLCSVAYSAIKFLLLFPLTQCFSLASIDATPLKLSRLESFHFYILPIAVKCQLSPRLFVQSLHEHKTIDSEINLHLSLSQITPKWQGQIRLELKVMETELRIQ